MKVLPLIILLMLGGAVILFISASGDLSTYGGFDDATYGEKIKVVGQLDKRQPVIYNPELDGDRFSFYMEDERGRIKKVVVSQSKPMDFERSEQIVVTGEMKEDVFYASDILLKCPSKYKDEEIQIRAEE